MTSGSLLAIDLGASSGRVILGRVGPDTLDLSELHRFRNGPVRLRDGLYWDVLGLYTDVLIGLRAAVGQGVVGVAVDSWAVDYGLLDAEGVLLGNPRHYRDNRHARSVDAVHAQVDPAALFGINGLQHLPFNTIFQLAGDARMASAASLLLVPDLLGYWLGADQVTELTNASTTGLVDACTSAWSPELLTSVGIPAGLLAPIVAPGEVIGGLSFGVRADTGLGPSVRLTTVGSHDTASAVLGVPAKDGRFAYISCGTWGLVGVELDQPVLTSEARAANFTNERGVDATVRFLRNVMGLWLLQESLRDWALAGRPAALGPLLAEAATLAPGGPTFDADSGAFMAPGDMPARVLHAAGLPAGTEPHRVVRCILDSLAAALARGVHDAVRLSGQSVDVVHMVGGGAQNALLCQLTADAIGLPVVAGPVEATAIGNLLVQARTHHLVEGDRWTLRALVRATQPITRYMPSSVTA